MVTRSSAPRSPRATRAAVPLAAFVLHRYDWSESSLILDLFTREQGRIAVAAKGAKRPYSQLRSVLLPFQRLRAGRRRSRCRGANAAWRRVGRWHGDAHRRRALQRLLCQ
jgi:Recombination protein O N terminal